MRPAEDGDCRQQAGHKQGSVAPWDLEYHSLSRAHLKVLHNLIVREWSCSPRSEWNLQGRGGVPAAEMQPTLKHAALELLTCNLQLLHDCPLNIDSRSGCPLSKARNLQGQGWVAAAGMQPRRSGLPTS